MNITASGLCMGCMSPLHDYIVCPECGYDNATPHDAQYLQPGSTLGGRYIVGRVIRKNGEGAMYIGHDNNLHTRVYIREYFPFTLAERESATGYVMPKDGCDAQYKTLLSDFIDVCNEVKRLSITEPVVPIENVLIENGTYYAVYKDMQLVSLETWLGQHGGKLALAEARDLLLPLLNSLSNIHDRSGDIHRGLSPYTVYIDGRRNLYLWDFCMSAARTGGSELEAELFHGYSAPEQYATNGWQGTWTDVYSAAALFYRVVSGFIPPKSTQISPQRPLAPLVDLVIDMPPNISDAVQEAMVISPDDRTQEIGAFTARLIQTNLSNTAVYDTTMVSEVKKKNEEKRMRRIEKRRRGKYMALGLLVTVLVLGTIAYVVMFTYFPDLISLDQAVARPDNSLIQQSIDTDDESGGEDDPDENAVDGSEADPEKTMPNLVGMQYKDIVSNPDYFNRFTIDEQYMYSAETPAGAVIEQKPEAGVSIENNRTVILYISKPPIMPAVEGKTLQEALVELNKLVEETAIDIPIEKFATYREGHEPGEIISTTPAAGNEIDPSTGVLLIYMSDEVPESSASSGLPTPFEVSPDEGAQGGQVTAPPDDGPVLDDSGLATQRPHIPEDAAENRPLASDFEQQFWGDDVDQ